jgi:hypothetical protein
MHLVISCSWPSKGVKLGSCTYEGAAMEWGKLEKAVELREFAMADMCDPNENHYSQTMVCRVS